MSNSCCEKWKEGKVEVTSCEDKAKAEILEKFLNWSWKDMLKFCPECGKRLESLERLIEKIPPQRVYILHDIVRGINEIIDHINGEDKV